MSEERSNESGLEDSSEDRTSEDKPCGSGASPKVASGNVAAADGDIQATEETCQNCGTSLHGEYCHACGQRHIPRLRARELMRHFADSILDISDLGGGLWSTLLEGTRNPGRLALRYAKGERKRFVNPISYFLIATTLMFLLLTLIRAEWIQGMSEVYRTQWTAMGLNPKEMFGPDGLYRTAFGLKSIEDFTQVVFRLLKQTQTYLSLFFCLIAAGLLRALMSGYTSAELVVLELYATAQAKLFYVVVSPVLLVMPTTFWFVLGPVLQLGVLVFAGRHFFSERWKGGLLPPLAYVGAYLVVILISCFVGLLVGLGIGMGVIGG